MAPTSPLTPDRPSSADAPGSAWSPPAPMKATPSQELPQGDGWVFEIKWDGMRAIVLVVDGQVRLASANGIDATDRFPELAGLASSVAARRAVLDGEIVALDAGGVPRFGLLQPRMQSRSRSGATSAAAERPASLVLFDVLEIEGSSTAALTYDQRRQLLESLVEPGPRWVLTPVHEDGEAVLAAAAAQGHEGVVAKRRDSRYEAGRRSTAWRKVKVRREQELVVGGWMPGAGERSKSFGALLVGYHDAEGALRYAGRVGTGFDRAALDVWVELLRDHQVDPCPFDPPPPPAVARQARWVAPEIVVQVGFGEWTADGILRHPAYLGFRQDKAARDVVREPV